MLQHAVMFKRVTILQRCMNFVVIKSATRSISQKGRFRRAYLDADWEARKANMQIHVLCNVRSVIIYSMPVRKQRLWPIELEDVMLYIYALPVKSANVQCRPDAESLRILAHQLSSLLDIDDDRLLMI